MIKDLKRRQDTISCHNSLGKIVSSACYTKTQRQIQYKYNTKNRRYPKNQSELLDEELSSKSIKK